MPRILAVDDMPQVLRTLGMLLEAHVEDCDLATAGSGAEGIDLARAFPPDLALIDQRMPGMTGIEMVRRLKADEATAGFPIVLMTAHETGPRRRIEGLEAGADDFISKPFDSMEFVARIRVMLRIKRAEDELRRANAHLEQTVAERTAKLLSHKQQLQRLASQLCRAEDHERRRIAEDLHDDVSQSLAAMSMNLQVVRGADLPETQATALEEALHLLRKTASAVRTMTFELCPPMLHETGLEPALTWLIEESGVTRPPCRYAFDCPRPLPPLCEELRGFAFRAVRELLINAAKHAGATRVSVRATADDGELVLSVRDDGTGIDPSSAAGPTDSEGFGLFAIRERADGFGGRLDVQAPPEGGSIFTLVLPVPDREAGAS